MHIIYHEYCFLGIKMMYYSIKKQYRAFYTVNNSVR